MHKLSIHKSALRVFDQLTDAVRKLSPQQYSRPSIRLMNHSVGQHVRHVIELYQCLEEGYDAGLVNYDQRRRDRDIETDKDLAISLMERIPGSIQRPDKELLLQTHVDPDTDDVSEIPTNYYRELAYNLEHAIHHMALIRIGIEEISNLTLSEEFGVASSTLKYRQQCAQ